MAMLGNKVSPATLYIASDSSIPTDNGSGMEDSQLYNSQASLFSSEPQSSMELFSQLQPDKFIQHSTTQQKYLGMLAKTELKLQPEISLSRKFYLKYLNCANKQESKKRKSGYEDSQTSGRKSQSGTVYEGWKAEQMEKSESQQFIVSVVQKTIMEGMKAVKDELRSEIDGLKAVVSEQQSGLANDRQLVTQILSNLADLKQCVEEHFCMCKDSLAAKIETHASPLTKQLDQQIKDLLQKTQSIETHIENTHTLVRNLTPLLTKKEDTSSIISESKHALEDDQAVPCQQDALGHLPDNSDSSLCQNIPFHCHTCKSNKEAPCSESKSGNSQTVTGQSGYSTAYDIDLSKQSPSACSQVIAHILQQEDSTKCAKTLRHKDTPTDEKKNGLKRKRIQSTQRHKTTQRTPIKRRSQRLQRTLKRPCYESSNLEHAVTADLVKTEAIQGESNQKSSHRSVISSIVRTPRSGSDTAFFSQTPHFKNVSEHSQPQVFKQCSTSHKPQLVPQNVASAGKFDRSTEAAKRRVQVFAGLTKTTSAAALLELSNCIKTVSYLSDESP